MPTDSSPSVLDRLRAQWKRQDGEATMARGAAGSLIVKVATAAVNLGLHLVLANVLGEDIYGKYIYAFTWLHFASLAGSLGFPTASVRFVATYRGQQAWRLLAGYLRFSRRLVLAASVGVAVVLAAGAALIVEDADLRLTFFLAAASLPVMTRVQLYGTELQGFKQVVRAIVANELVRPIVLFASVAVAFLLLGVEVSAARTMAFQVGALMVACAVAFVMIRRAVPEAVRVAQEERETRLWWTTARDMLLIAGFNLVLFQIDTLMLGLFQGTTPAGIYAVVSRVATLLVFVLVAVNGILAPMAADLYASDQHEALQRLVTLGARAVFAASLVGGGVLVAFDREILGLFGDEFAAGNWALWALVAGQLVNAWAGPAVVLLNMTNHQQTSMRILGASAALNLVLNAALIPFFGLVGAALATMTTMVVWNVSAALAVRRHLSLSSTAFTWSRPR